MVRSADRQTDRELENWGREEAKKLSVSDPRTDGLTDKVASIHR